jgi:hypothetical protein
VNKNLNIFLLFIELRTVDVWFVNADAQKYTMEPYVGGKFMKVILLF